ncbi:MAG: DUF3943 domain-containing protein [Tannerellaceae bacterium]|nr:DUF3943 domain-containing protein [Tannerellaceae bacterium]
MKQTTIILLFLVFSFYSSGQHTQDRRFFFILPPDSADIHHYSSSKKGFQAGTTVFGINMGVWIFDRFIQKGDFAYINGHTIKENFRHGFIWDNDRMGTNMFLHPYHGSLYYNAARSNGYNYWQSGLFSLAGSTMWELFMECEYPSTNDIIATPLGGMALGEVFYRASDLILDDRTSGKEQLGRETIAFLTSPMRGLTRIINGDAWRKRPTSDRQFGLPPVSVEVSAGIRILELQDDIFDQGIGFGSEVRIEYGDKFEADRGTPYDYFSIQTNLNIQASQPVLGELSIIGRIASKELLEKEKQTLSTGLYQHFDYYDSDTISDISLKTPYKFCTPASFGGGLFYRNETFKRGYIEGAFHLNGILLGAALSDYYRVDERNYNLANGLSTKFSFNYSSFNRKIQIGIHSQTYYMFTWKDYPEQMDWENFNPKTLNAQGDRSRAQLYHTSFRMDYRLRKNLYLTGDFSSYVRRTYYKYYENVYSSTSESKLMLTYRFK